MRDEKKCVCCVCVLCACHYVCMKKSSHQKCLSSDDTQSIIRAQKIRDTMFVDSCQVDYICFKTIHSPSFLCFISILFKGICLHKAANKKNTGAKTHTVYLHTLMQHWAVALTYWHNTESHKVHHCTLLTIEFVFPLLTLMANLLQKYFRYNPERPHEALNAACVVFHVGIEELVTSRRRKK